MAIRRIQQALATALGIVWLLAFTSHSEAQTDYRIIPPNSPVTAGIAHSFFVISEGDITPLPIKNTSALDWRPTTTAPRNLGNVATLSFIPRREGELKFPPIPLLIGGQKVFLRLDPVDVVPNTQDENVAEFIPVWNGSTTPPAILRVGQEVDLEMLTLTRERPRTFIDSPEFEISNVRWWRDSPRGEPRFDTRFYPFYYRPYQEQRGMFRGNERYVRRYKTRFTVLSGESAKGSLSAKLSDSSGDRVEYVPVDIPIKPLPPQPDGNYFTSGLIGDWNFSASISPQSPAADEPFTIILTIDGRGDESMLDDLDFSSPGFKSVSSEMKTIGGTSFDRFRGRFVQTLIADGSNPVYPALSVLSFDTKEDQWKIHRLAPSIRFADIEPLSAALNPSTTPGTAITKPILLNLHPSIFVAFGLAPFFPLLSALAIGAAKKQQSKKNPRRKLLRAALRELDSGRRAQQLFEEKILPLLRDELKLPSGASTGEVAEKLHQSHPELATMLRDHSDASFTGKPSPITSEKLKSLVPKAIIIAVLCLLPLASLRADELEEKLTAAAEDFNNANFKSAITDYEALLDDYPDHPAVHLNLARARLATGEFHLARASAYTAFLLDPLDGDTREVLDTTYRRLGDPALPGSAAFALRPDQLLILGCVLWALGFTYLAIRRFRPLPLVPGPALIVLAGLCVAAAIWRNSTAYVPEQFMVITPETQRQSEPGKPDFERPALRSGEIIQATSLSDDGRYVLVETPDTSFWLPAADLRQVW